VHEGNGLTRVGDKSTGRYDGLPLDTPTFEDTLYVITREGTYNGTVVEIKEYVGLPDDQLIKVRTILFVSARLPHRLADHYRTRGRLPNRRGVSLSRGWGILGLD
jgi:hypothetical protein